MRASRALLGAASGGPKRLAGRAFWRRERVPFSYGLAPTSVTTFEGEYVDASGKPGETGCTSALSPSRVASA
jgi:hypothetical protein